MTWFCTVTAILVIGVLEGIALVNGINGVAFATSLAIIGGLGGYGTKAAIDKRKATK